MTTSTTRTGNRATRRAAATDKPFTYTSPDGSKTITLPAITNVKKTFDVLEAIADKNETLCRILFFRQVASTEALATIRTLDEDELNTFFEEWAAAGGVTAGE